MILRHSRHNISVVLILTAAIMGFAVSAAAQSERGGQPGLVTVQSVVRSTADAREVREQLMGVFQQYPPSVREVFKLDPVLLTNANYLAMYPSLAGYLAQHPEVAHNPAYFIGLPNNFGGYGDGREESIGRSLSYVIEPHILRRRSLLDQ